MHEIAEYLSGRPPFEGLDPEALERLAATVEIEFFAAGATVFQQGAPAPDHTRVIRSGAIELLDDGRVLDRLGEGELFGHPSMLSGLPTGFAARAVEDTLVYRLPSEAMVEVLAAPAGLRYVARSLGERARLGATHGTRFGDELSAGPVARLVRDAPVIVAQDTTIRAAAERMTRAGVTALLVGEPGRIDGILTDRDLRTNVVAGDVPADAPVSAVMTAAVHTVAADRPGGEVLLDMLAQGVRHLPVVATDGTVLGIVQPTDLLITEGRAPFGLRREIGAAPDVDTLVNVAGKLSPALIALHDTRVAAEHVSAVMSLLVDALTRRLIELTVQRLGDPPAPVAWLALGSLGRAECVPSSDVDSALVWEGDDRDPTIRAWTDAVATDVLHALEACGLRSDQYGVAATDARLARSVDAWRTALDGWIADPLRNQGAIYISLLYDAHIVWGSSELAPLASRMRDARNHPGLLRLLGRLAVRQRSPTGFLGNIVVEHSGEHRGRLDIKHGGTSPVTSLARYGGLAAGSAATTTPGRLRAAAGSTIDDTDAQMLEEAFDLLHGLRLEHQIDQLREGHEPDNLLDPQTLNPLTRRYLREAFRAVTRVQRAVQRDLGT